MKHYRGFRDSTDTAHVVIETEATEPPKPLPHLVRHSPTGFEWGYGGSGPADLARSLLADALGHDVHPRIYQMFKAGIVARIGRAGFVMTDEDVRLNVEGLRTQLGIVCVQCIAQGFIDAGDDTDYCSCPIGRELKRDLEGENVDAES